jgi:hypothetical protein
METRPSFRLKFVSFEFDRFPNSRCRAQVALEHPGGGLFTGTSEAVGASASGLRCAALAALKALERAVTGAGRFELLGVKAIRVFDTNVVIVALSAKRDSRVHRLVGSYLAEENPERGAAIAVLNATNRFLGNSIFAE